MCVRSLLLKILSSIPEIFPCSFTNFPTHPHRTHTHTPTHQHTRTRTHADTDTDRDTHMHTLRGPFCVRNTSRFLRYDLVAGVASERLSGDLPELCCGSAGPSSNTNLIFPRFARFSRRGCHNYFGTSPPKGTARGKASLKYSITRRPRR